MKLCPNCQVEIVNWLGYQPPAPIKLTSHGPDGPRRTVPHGDRVYATIRDQQRLIRQHCAANHPGQQKSPAEAGPDSGEVRRGSPGA